MNITSCSCGSKPELQKKAISNGDYVVEYVVRVRCGQCGKSSREVECEVDGLSVATEEVIEKWNRRNSKISRRKI